MAVAKPYLPTNWLEESRYNDSVSIKFDLAMKERNVLLVDTNRGAYPLLKTLEANGCNVTTIGSDSSAPLAKLCKSYIQADYTDKAVLQAIAEKGKYWAIIPGCTDASYHACASLSNCSRIGIDHADAIAKIFNKQGLRRLAMSIGIPQPSELSEAEALQSETILIKPVDSYSGAGIIKLDRPSRLELQAAIVQAREASPSQEVLIEEYINGQLYSHSAFMEEQVVKNDFFVKEDCIDFSYAVDTSCLAQDLSLDIQQQVRDSIERLAIKLQLRDGLLHTQFILRDDAAYVIEMTRRHPGDLYSMLIQYSTGFNYPAEYINAFLPTPIRSWSPDQEKRFIIRHTVTAGSGRDLWGLRFNLPVKINNLIPLAKAGDKLDKAPKGRAAILFLESSSKGEHEEIYRNIISKKLYSFED